MGVISDGNSYGVPDDLLYSFPVVIKVGRHGRRVHTRAHAHTHDIKYVHSHTLEHTLQLSSLGC